MLVKNNKICLAVIKVIVTLDLILIIFGCGVKGKPLPPEQAPEISRGERLLDINKAKAAEKAKKNKQTPKKSEPN